MIWFHYPVWIKGEALRQILVNRYYGNIRPSGRRESLTSFGNGPLSPGGPSKPGGGGRLCAVLMSVICELSMSHVAVCFCLTTWNWDVFVLEVFFGLVLFYLFLVLFCNFFYLQPAISLLHEQVPYKIAFPYIPPCMFCIHLLSPSLMQWHSRDTRMVQKTRFHCPVSCDCEQLYLLIDETNGNQNDES